MKKPPRLDLNPSSAERWTTCTASPHFILENWDKLPDDTSRFAEEGTTAHEVAAAYLLDRKPGECPTPVQPEMHVHGWDYMEYVQNLRTPGSKLIVETKFPLWYMPERNAMVDAAVVNKESLHIVDYKYGEGIIVSPVENLQGAIYARSVGPRLGFQPPEEFPVHIHIYQPRGRDMTQPHHTWETTWGELAMFTSDRIEKPARNILMQQRTMSAKTGQPIVLQFVPSDKACQWCPAKGFCSARQQFLTRDLEDLTVIEDKPLPLATTLSEEQRILIQRHGSDIKKWIDDVQEYNTQRGTEGHVLRGFKLVLSRGGNRYWTNQKAVIDGLLADTVLRRNDIVEEKVIGPAAVEKLLGKGKLPASVINLIDKPPGSPVLVPVEDKRPAIGNAASEFEKISEE